MLKYNKVICWLFASLLLLALVGCTQQKASFQGYIEGRYIYLSSAESGTLESLLISRGQQVAAGQTAFILDPQPQAAKLAQAQEQLHQAGADVSQAEANLVLSQRNLVRQQVLLQKKATQQQQVDIAQRDVEVSEAQLAAAQANFKAVKAAYTQAKWSQTQKIIMVPTMARVFDTYYLPGEFVPSGHPIAALLPPQEIKAIFFVPESALGQLRINQKILVNCDNCHPVYAKINYISPAAEYTPPVVYSQTRRYHLAYRIEADLPSEQAANYHPGQPVDIEINDAVRH